MPELHSLSQHDIDHREQLAEVLEEITERIEAGDSVDLGQYQQQYPELAEQLRKLIPAVSVLEGLGRSESQRPKEDTTLVNRLGDFRIIREIGRGGMGTVFEAQQLSMDRRVALKVLPFAALLGDRQLVRFKNEARTAGTLHHPHIVPVYSVGVERGVHYYAMQYIEGPSLAEVLIDLRGEAAARAGDVSLEPSDLPPTTDLRLVSERSDQSQCDTSSPLSRLQERAECEGDRAMQPESTTSSIINTRRDLQALLSTARSSSSERKYFEMITRWGIQACEALAHAHESGVLHRDIKPGNLLVDERGELWITDFGLARLEKDASMTTSGDIVGTLRYMAPEQALGKRVLIDHRADIYSLGATLYELLTLQPAFSGDDREALLQSVAYNEPVSLRKHDASIPSDLETIVLKTLEKRPEDRYLTAEELADDLKRFLDNKPIQAKPASLLQHAAKWSRRHVAVVWSLVFVFLAASVLMGIATAAVMRERSRTKAALERAQTSAQLAKEAVDDMYVNFAEEWIRNQVGLSDTERSFLEKAATFYEQMPVALEASPAAQVGAAKTLRRLSEARRKLGQVGQAKDAIDQAVVILDALHAKSPDSRTVDSRLELAECLLSLNRIEGRPRPGAVDSVQRAAKELNQLTAERPDDREVSHRLAVAKSHLAVHHYQLQEFDEADRLHAEAQKQLQQLVDASPDDLDLLNSLCQSVARRARSCLTFGHLGTREGKRDEARRLFLLSIELAERLSEKSPGNLRYRYRAAQLRTNAEIFVDLEVAIKLLRESSEQLKSLVRLDPARSDFKDTLGRVYGHLFAALRNCSRHEEAVEAIRQHIAMHDEPGSLDYRSMSYSLTKLARWQEAREAIEVAIRLERKNTKSQGSVDQLGTDLTDLANICRELGDEEAARTAESERQELLNAQIAELTRTIEQEPTFQAHFGRAGLFQETGDAEKALEDYTKCIELDPERHTAYERRADILMDTFRCEEALEDIQHAIRLRPRDMSNDHDLYATRAMLLYSLDRDEEAVRDCNTVLQSDWCEYHHNLMKRGLVRLLTFGVPEVRDPERALELATQLLESKRSQDSLMLAGLAYYRLGRYEEARDALQESSDCGQLPYDSLDWTWTTMAMAQAQLGDEQDAHKWFSKGLDLFSKNTENVVGGDCAAVRRLIHEAADLLEFDLSATMWAKAPEDPADHD